MRNFLLFVMLVCSFLCGEAQRLNERGQKMVSKIEITSYHQRLTNWVGYCNIWFSYDGTNLAKIVRETTSNTYEGIAQKNILTLNNGVLKRVDYEEGRLERFLVFDYTLKNGLITRIDRINKDMSGGSGLLVKRTDLHFHSDCDEHRLKDYVETVWVREPGKKDFVKTDGKSADIQDFFWENGNYLMRNTWISPRGGEVVDDKYSRRYQYGERLNDTNINWNYLAECYITGSSYFANPEFFTEWIGLRSDHLLEGYRGVPYHDFEYLIDDNGNITMIKVYTGSMSWLEYEVKIEYVQ